MKDVSNWVARLRQRVVTLHTRSGRHTVRCGLANDPSRVGGVQSHSQWCVTQNNWCRAAGAASERPIDQCLGAVRIEFQNRARRPLGRRSAIWEAGRPDDPGLLLAVHRDGSGSMRAQERRVLHYARRIQLHGESAGAIGGIRSRSCLQSSVRSSSEVEIACGIRANALAAMLVNGMDDTKLPVPAFSLKTVEVPATLAVPVWANA